MSDGESVEVYVVCTEASQANDDIPMVALLNAAAPPPVNAPAPPPKFKVGTARECRGRLHRHGE